MIKTIDFHGDVDNLRYDAPHQRLYVGYGKTKRGRSAPSMPQPTKGCQKNTSWALQLESPGTNIFVNLPDLKQIAVINRKTHAIIRWPMTWSTISRWPWTKRITASPWLLTSRRAWRFSIPTAGKALPYFLAFRTLTIPITTPEGSAYTSREEKDLSACFEQTDADQYRILAKEHSTIGARPAGYFGKGRTGCERVFLAVPARPDHGAEIWIYTVRD